MQESAELPGVVMMAMIKLLKTATFGMFAASVTVTKAINRLSLSKITID